MKKIFEKKDIAKAIGAMILLAVVLTWIIPYGTFNGTSFYEYGVGRLGLTDMTTLGYYGLYLAIDKLVFLLVLGGFYGLLATTKAYQKITSSIAKCLKGKELVTLILTSVVVALLTSISTTVFGMLIFVPFIITVLSKAKFDKVSTFAATFGSMLVGVFGATFGTEGLTLFNQYFVGSTGVDVLGSTLLFRIVFFLISLLLLNFFVVLRNKKVSKNNEMIAEDTFEVEDNKDKKVNVIPLAIVLGLVALFTLLGNIYWAGIGVNIFGDFHTWLTGLTIGEDFTLFSYLLGTTSLAFGAWDLFTFTTLLLVGIVLVTVVSKIGFSDMLSFVGKGIVKVLKPAVALIGVYAIFVAFYMCPMVTNITSKLLPIDEKPTLNIDYNGNGVAYFNIDTDDDLKADFNLINQDTNKDGKCDINCDTDKDGWPDANLDFDGDGKITKTDTALLDSEETGTPAINLDADGDGISDTNMTTNFNYFKAVVAALFTNIFHVDLGYTGYTVGAYLLSGFGAVALTAIFLIYVLTYGFIQFFAPSSIILMVGLAYSKMEYKTWLKFAWMFLLGLLVCLAALFILLAVL